MKTLWIIAHSQSLIGGLLVIFATIAREPSFAAAGLVIMALGWGLIGISKSLEEVKK